MTREEKGMQFFTQGYSCAQSVCLAFSDMVDLPEKTIAKIASSFGGGMGRLREVCGCVTGMFIIAGLLYGYDSPDTGDIKTEHYARVQKLASDFSDLNGTIVCRNLLGLSVQKEEPKPSERTTEYYKKRPCMQLVGNAIKILSKYIDENPV